MLGKANWIEAAFNGLIISIIVRFLFWLMRICFTVFSGIAKLNVFNGNIYDDITKRIYSVISIVMLFVFAYQIILLVINPDKDTKGLSNLVKDIFISFIFVILMPLIFNYASILQTHIIDNNTIPAILLNTNGTDTDTKGYRMIKIVFTSFFHPTGTDYDTFYTSEDAISGDAQSKCVEAVSASSQGGNDAAKICETYIEGLTIAQDYNDRSIFDAFFGKTMKLVQYDGNDGFTCDLLLMIIVGVYITWLFISYAIDLGTRCVKLLALEVIAPVPMVLRILPKTKGTFDKWLKEIMKTYLEVFVRLAFIFFIIFMCGEIPEFLKVVAVGLSSNHKIIATICLILGILKFAKDAPEMLKKIFDTGSGLFSGLDLKGGVRRRVQENEYAMRGLNAGSAMIGGGIARFRSHGGFEKGEDGKRHVMRTLGSTTLGSIAGGLNGWKSDNKSVGINDLIKTGTKGAQASEDAAVNLKTKLKKVKEIPNRIHSKEDIAGYIDQVLLNGGFSNAGILIDLINKDDISRIDIDVSKQLADLQKQFEDIINNNSEVKKAIAQRDKAKSEARSNAFAEYNSVSKDSDKAKGLVSDYIKKMQEDYAKIEHSDKPEDVKAAQKLREKIAEAQNDADKAFQNARNWYADQAEAEAKKAGETAVAKARILAAEDSRARLEAIRDMQNNILKSTSYALSGGDSGHVASEAKNLIKANNNLLSGDPEASIEKLLDDYDGIGKDKFAHVASSIASKRLEDISRTDEALDRILSAGSKEIKTTQNTADKK